MAAKWYRLDAYGSSRQHIPGWRSTLKFTDLDKVTVFAVPRGFTREAWDQLADMLRGKFGSDDCIVVTDDVRLFRLEEVSEEEVIAEELMKP